MNKLVWYHNNKKSINFVSHSFYLSFTLLLFYSVCLSQSLCSFAQMVLVNPRRKKQMEEIWYIACKGLETWDALIHVLYNLCRLKCFNLTHVTTPALHSQTVSKENIIIWKFISNKRPNRPNSNNNLIFFSPWFQTS